MTAATKLEHKMTCLCCGNTHWENVDQYRLKPAGMAICTSCGFVSYPDKWASYEEIKAYYRKSYRQPPKADNFFTGQRKIYFHQTFLADLFKKWQDEGMNTPQVFEVGAAYGIVLDWLKNEYPKGSFRGTEWAESYKRNAKHEYGLNLIDDFDSSEKYDLIISYKVAEHQLDVHNELRKYALCLTDKGHLYISVPTWFDSANNFGMTGFDLDYYYDPNHVNCWTRKAFENLLARSGLKVIKQDHMIYDSTYLCVRDDSLMNTPLYREDVENIKDRMKRMKEAYLLFVEQKYEQAIKTYPDYPAAHISLLELKRQDLKNLGWEKFKETYIKPMFEQCPTSNEVWITATDFAMRAEQWKEAIDLAHKALEYKPQNPATYSQLVQIMREMGLRATDQETKTHYFKQARNIAQHIKAISAQHFREATDMIYTFNALIP